MATSQFPQTVFVTLQTAANILGISKRTIQRMLAEERFPPPIQLRGERSALHWRRTDIDKWAAELAPKPYSPITAK